MIYSADRVQFSMAWKPPLHATSNVAHLQTSQTAEPGEKTFLQQSVASQIPETRKGVSVPERHNDCQRPIASTL